MKDPDTTGAIVIALGFLGFLAFLIFMQIGVWNECRTDHSWWYCLNLMRR